MRLPLGQLGELVRAICRHAQHTVVQPLQRELVRTIAQCTATQREPTWLSCLGAPVRVRAITFTPGSTKPDNRFDFPVRGHADARAKPAKCFWGRACARASRASHRG